MRTVVIGTPTPRHLELQAAAHEALLAVEDNMKPGKTFGEVFAAHAAVMDDHGMVRHRLNACGYSLGARFTPSWMDMPMFYANNPVEVQSGMVLFAHMIIMDSETNTAMCLGRTSLIGETGAEPLSRLALDLIVK
jgi:Xaa-Pro dipeptidase